MDRKRLIDTRGRQTLMQTAQQRRDSVQASSRGRMRSQKPEPPIKMRRPNVDLGAMLKPDHLPPNTYYSIQSVLFEQDKLITERGNEIKDRCKQISVLKQDLDDANARIGRDEKRLRKKPSDIAGLEKQLVQAKKNKETITLELRNRKRSFDEINDDQEDLINVGRKILSEKNQEAERLARENKQLRATISDRDRTISSLNHQILRISMAPGNEMAAIAIESQAQRTLSMVKGLQSDVAQRDTIIEDFTAKNEALIATNECFKTENADLKTKVTEVERAFKAVEKRAIESKEILEEQNKLIDRLMKGNARFLEASQKSK